MAQRGLLYETAEAITRQLEKDEWLRDTSDRGPFQGPSERTAQSQPRLQSIWQEATHLSGTWIFWALTAFSYRRLRGHGQYYCWEHLPLWGAVSTI